MKTIRVKGQVYQISCGIVTDSEGDVVSVSSANCDEQENYLFFEWMACKKGEET